MLLSGISGDGKQVYYISHGLKYTRDLMYRHLTKF